MIVALVNQKGGVGKTTLALHLAGQWAQQGRKIIVLDGDPQGSALDWSTQRAAEGLPRLFSVVGLPRETLHHEAAELAAQVDHLIIDAPPRVAGLLRAALFACDLAVVPIQPSPLDGWASAETLKLIEQARIFRPEIRARFLLNRYPARTLIGRATSEALADQDPPLLAQHVGQRVIYADAMRTGRLVHELDARGPAAGEIARLAVAVEMLAPQRPKSRRRPPVSRSSIAGRPDRVSWRTMMHTIEQIQAAWKALPRRAKRKAWNAFTRSVDSGDQGYDPFYLVLWPMWQGGLEPV